MPSSINPNNPLARETGAWPKEMRPSDIPENHPIEKKSENFVIPAQEKHEQFKEKENPVKSDSVLESAVESIRHTFQRTKKPLSASNIVRDELALQVEKIMEDGIQDAFKELTPVQQQEFKIAGEKTALQIRDLLRSAHVKIKKIFRLLLSWLRMLPGINVFFLEQEAKIKADKILALNNWTKKQ